MVGYDIYIYIDVGLSRYFGREKDEKRFARFNRD